MIAACLCGKGIRGLRDQQASGRWRMFLRALARDLNASTPGKGVGVIGQCFTGGFALAAAVDDSVLAPVLSQPSLPMPLTPAQRRDPGLDRVGADHRRRSLPPTRACARMGLRFSEDTMSPGERFATLKERLGDAFEVIEIDSRPGQRTRFRQGGAFGADPEVREVDGQPAYEARKRVVEFLKQRLA